MPAEACLNKPDGIAAPVRRRGYLAGSGARPDTQ